MKADLPANGWIQICTDLDRASENIIDANPNSPFYPFYFLGYNKTLLDAPWITYSIFRKPLSIWKAHAFAVHVDPKERTIKYLGGVGWGYKLGLFSILPEAIKPYLLTKADWNEAWNRYIKDKMPKSYVLAD